MKPIKIPETSGKTGMLEEEPKADVSTHKQVQEETIQESPVDAAVQNDTAELKQETNQMAPSSEEAATE
ncbi:MAG: hypothetical protein D3924_19840 [Candidatus Electrothrix sp. AR4]|nr:hypothetical protein [Candidatus Electrothrix sp. AR4]